VAGVSFPIRDGRDRVIASLTVSGPLTRVNTATIDHYTAIVRDGALRERDTRQCCGKRRSP
jgi:DNA-binding IclR family transcriptional regulator